MKIIHLSDLHIGRWNNYEKSEVLIKKIRSRYISEIEKPAIVITGDIVIDGLRSQFLEAKFLIDNLTDYEILLCPGNHEMGRSGVTVEPDNINKYEKYLKESIDFPVLKKIKDCHFISLNSLEGEMEKEDNTRADGYCGKDQLDNLNNQIKNIKNNNPNDKIIVYLHHHPFIYNNYLKLKDADKLLDVIKGKINILLFGHKHIEKRLIEEENKYGINIIFASGKSNNLVKGSLSETKNKSVYRFIEIDTDSFDTSPVEILV